MSAGCRGRYCIEDGYEPRLTPRYFQDQGQLVYQPEVYELAYYLAKRLGAGHVIDIGAGSGEKLKRFAEDFEITAIGSGPNVDLLRRSLPNHEVLEWDLERGLPSLRTEVVSNAIVIVADVIEHIKTPHSLLEALSDLSHQCPFLLISTPDRVRNRGVGDCGPPANPAHVREWAIEEFHSLLYSYGFAPFLIGYTINTAAHQWKNTILVVSGVLARPKINAKALSVLAVINVYNEADIIYSVVDYLLAQGVDVRIVDNWSSDGSYEIVRELAEGNKRVSVERFPQAGPSAYYEWAELLRHVEDVAYCCEYDWIMHHDADEIRVPPWDDQTLRDAISLVDSLGFNAIDFTVLDFRPVRDGFSPGMNPQEFFSHFEFGTRPGHFLQIKGWKNRRGRRVSIASSGGHDAQFQDRRVFPMKFLMKHYPLRSTRQARDKIFRDRIPRISQTERTLGWHIRYDSFVEDFGFLWDKRSLVQFVPNAFQHDFLVERISGVGVVRA